MPLIEAINVQILQGSCKAIERPLSKDLLLNLVQICGNIAVA